MNICLIARAYPRSLDEPIVSGSIKNPFYLSRFLSERGHDVTVITHASDPETTIQDGIRVHRLPHGRLRGAGRTATNGLLATRKVRDLEGVREFDIVNAHYPAAAIGVFRDVDRWETPVVSTAHGTILPEIEANIGSRSLHDLAHYVNAHIRKRIDQYAWERSDLVVSAGDYQVEEMSTLYEIDPRKIRSIPNGVDTQLYCPDDGLRRDGRDELAVDDQNLVLFVGRLVKKKGVQHLIRAATEIRSEQPKTEFLVIGGTEEFDEYGETLRSMIRERGLTDCFRIRSGIPERRMPVYYNAADICVVPSTGYEPLPTVVFEGMACGNPVLGSNTGGIPDQLGQTETTVPERSHGDIADMIISILSDDDLREQYGARNRQRAVEEFDWRKTVKQYEDTFQGVI